MEHMIDSSTHLCLDILFESVFDLQPQIIHALEITNAFVIDIEVNIMFGVDNEYKYDFGCLVIY